VLINTNITGVSATYFNTSVPSAGITNVLV